MNNRIRQFMNEKGLTSAELADTIGVQRSNLTHVLNGRNKPSFQFISKLLETYTEIDAKWLLLGQGQMFEDSDQVQEKSDLFSAPKPAESSSTPPTQPEKSTEEPEEPKLKETIAPVITATDKEVERIVVFYTDQTFKSYTPSK